MELERVVDGVFWMRDAVAMPCEPADIRIGYWGIPGMITQAPEEVIARILGFSIKSRFWMGVTWQKILRSMMEDIELARMWRAYEESSEWKSKWYWPFGRMPNAVKPTREKPVSIIFRPNGARELEQCVSDLIERGILEPAVVDDDKILCPTPELIQTLLHLQKRPFMRAS